MLASELGDLQAQRDPTMPRLSTALASTAAAVSVAALVGWLLDARGLAAWLDGRSTMKANVAVAMLLLTLSVLGRGRPAGRLAAVAAGVLALLTGSQYVTGVELGIDELLADDPVARGRMAPTTALAVLFLAAAAAATPRAGNLRTRGLVVVPMFVGTLALVGYLFGADHLYGGLVSDAEIALPTAVALVLLSLALLLRLPDSFVPWVLRGEDLGAVAARHVLPVALGVIPVVGFLSLVGMRRGWFDAAFGVAIMVCVDAAVVIGVAVRALRRLSTVDRGRTSAIEDLQMLTETLRDGRDAEWRRAEELRRDLEAEREKFGAAVAQLDDLVWTWRVDADGVPHLVFASSDASGIFGAPLEALGEDPLPVVAGLIHDDDADLAREFLRRVIRGRPDQMTVRLVGLDGDTRWVWVRARPRRYGEELYVDGISSNVTERQLAAQRQEELLRLEQEHVRRLEDLNVMRSGFLEVTGHELRTPLTTFQGYTELLLEDASLSGRQRSMLQVMARRAQQMTMLVEDLFELARFDSGTLPIEPRVLDVAEVVAEVLRDVGDRAAAAGVSVVAGGAPATVHADPRRLRQILDSLVSNAVKYGGPGTVTVTTDQLGGTAVVAVADQGPGISDEELPRLFDRMYRGERADREGIPGSGLGLALCRALVEAHGGTVTASNSPTGGAVFTVVLPAACSSGGGAASLSGQHGHA